MQVVYGGPDAINVTQTVTPTGVKAVKDTKKHEAT